MKRIEIGDRIVDDGIVHRVVDIWRNNGAVPKKGDDIELACRYKSIDFPLWVDKVTDEPTSCILCIGSVVSTA